jgi:hypothetical protein
MRSNREAIIIDGHVCAMVIRADFDIPEFSSLQTASIHSNSLRCLNKSGKVIPARTHNPARREVLYTQAYHYFLRSRSKAHTHANVG